jgi:hypothetical protein
VVKGQRSKHVFGREDRWDKILNNCVNYCIACYATVKSEHYKVSMLSEQENLLLAWM